ncbi:hypothetical protein VINI7043_10671, partial [Vibrio nigripulchritudo ATCC 27043]
MKRLIKLYMEKPELVGIVFLILLGVIFEIRSDGAF